MEEENRPQQENEQTKGQWQLQKENWYDRIPLSKKQLDVIIVVCWILLALTFVLIYLDAKDIFHLFGS